MTTSVKVIYAVTTLRSFGVTPNSKVVVEFSARTVQEFSSLATTIHRVTTNYIGVLERILTSLNTLFSYLSQ
ncbi:hypothetical protein DY000_02054334 [Brassica cretica]|uniref:Uncharacterized protein n=1 Tax=Brassica cretica TaxID=69181 RepID=A0ABQ7A733_BRACR|nr:hypothetical protein DY000_02054334 [Brassica cretica]